MKFLGLALLFLASALASAQAVILFRTSDPNENIDAPTGALAGSGWQFEGNWGAYLGTPIAPHFFISAKHVYNAGNGVFTYHGVNYTATQQIGDPFSDFTIWKIAETFPDFAPLYTSSDELGKSLVVIGRGTERGADVTINGILHGWKWGAATAVQRWGENIVSAIVHGGLDQYVYATFDQNGLTNEAHLSSGDSGGAVFLQDHSGAWKLAGISYSVDGSFYLDAAGSGGFDGALFDMRGLYVSDGGNPATYTLVAGPNTIPSGFYATRIGGRLAWIYSVIDPTGDADGDGTPNELQYALSLNRPTPEGLGLTSGYSNGAPTVTYRKLLVSDLQFQLQKASVLGVWSNVTAQESVVSTVGNVSTISAQIAAPAPAFLRVRITQNASPTSDRAAYRIRSAP